MRWVGRAGWLCAGAIAWASAWGEDYPARPIHVVVAMQPGSAGDAVARIVAQRLAAGMGQPLVVENITGAAGLIGAERIARSPADGYALGVLGDSMLTLLPHLQPQTRFDPLEDFEPVSLLAFVTSVLVVHPSVMARNVEQLVALARAHPEAMDYASGGVGSQQHVAMGLFSSAAGIALHHIPMRGPAQAAMEVASGRIPMMFVALSIALPLIRDGRLRPLAVAGAGRSALLPALPTVAESGLPDFVYTPWVALCAPAGTPAAAVARLNREVAAAVGDAGIRAQLAALGLEPATSSPAELRNRIRYDHMRMGKLIQASGMRGE